MFCKNCGKEIVNDVKFCPNCGASVETQKSTDQQQSVNNQNSTVEDKASAGMTILSALIPLVGFIYFFVKKGESPKKAEACMIAAVIGFIVSLCFYL